MQTFFHHLLSFIHFGFSLDKLFALNGLLIEVNSLNRNENARENLSHGDKMNKYMAQNKIIVL